MPFSGTPESGPTFECFDVEISLAGNFSGTPFESSFECFDVQIDGVVPNKISGCDSNCEMADIHRKACEQGIITDDSNREPADEVELISDTLTTTYDGETEKPEIVQEWLD